MGRAGMEPRSVTLEVDALPLDQQGDRGGAVHSTIAL